MGTRRAALAAPLQGHVRELPQELRHAIFGQPAALRQSPQVVLEVELPLAFLLPQPQVEALHVPAVRDRRRQRPAFDVATWRVDVHQAARTCTAIGQRVALRHKHGTEVGPLHDLVCVGGHQPQSSPDAVCMSHDDKVALSLCAPVNVLQEAECESPPGLAQALRPGGPVPDALQRARHAARAAVLYEELLRPRGACWLILPHHCRAIDLA
mmetsp:Transcript_34102/g.98153  ORF Transcript_34102/g.98153 Transcript_34102/m.98153 type:complete len:211 (-) Transcript_34102:476-1108(-)